MCGMRNRLVALAAAFAAILAGCASQPAVVSETPPAATDKAAVAEAAPKEP